MASSYAALVSLMGVIHDVEHHPSPPISLDQKQVESMTKHITFFQEFLQAYNPSPLPENDEEAADPLEMRIARAAYEAEDAIESHIVKSIQKLRSNKITRLLSFFRSFKEPKNANDEKIMSVKLCRDTLQRVIGEMDSIKKVVVVKVDSENKKKKALVVHDQEAMTSALASIARNETKVGSDAFLASIASNEIMVGSDDVLLEIMEKLTGGSLDFQVIPIGGMGGIGKTFLAKSICARRNIKDHFDICAWATISQNYNTGKILCEVLSQLMSSGATSKENDMVQLSGKSEDELGRELYQYLFHRRFLIVMDDMWSIDTWNEIQCYFPKYENGSRVLVTTRLSQLSSELNNDYSLHMSFLDDASSWILFSKTVFGEKSCPPELKKIGEKIVDNCRGLPLSIVVVGGVLKKMDATRGSWESVRDNFTSVVNMDNEKHCLRLLKLSYNHLPVYLKPCFLYMGVFEEDDMISVSMLVKLWVSEGFLKPTNGEALETTAIGFLQDLVDRNLILIGELGSTGSIKYCKIHDLLRDLSLKEGQKEGFYHVIQQPNPPQVIDTQRRVVIPRKTSKEKVRGHLRSMSYARSVICEYGKVPPCRNLGLLRTLHSYKLGFFGDKTYVNSLAFHCVNLRHLAIEARGISSFLPSVSLLWNLHTLIVSSSNNLYLLADFWKMPQFRHIEFVDECLCLPDPPNCNVRDGDAVIMENLHTLKGVWNFKCSEVVVKRIPSIKKLKLRYHGLEGTNNQDEDVCFVGNIKSLSGLESLSATLFSDLGGTSTPMQKLTFPHSLKKLSLCMEFGFKWDDLMLEKIGSLPLLEKLKLTWGCFGKGKWETVEGQFPCLKYLELRSCFYLENWMAAEKGSSIFPRLEHLRLECLVYLKEIPCELGSIDTLKSIHMFNCDEAVMSVKEMVDEQVELQGEEQLSFHVEVILWEKNEHLVNLAGRNFEVRSW